MLDRDACWAVSEFAIILRALASSDSGNCEYLIHAFPELHDGLLEVAILFAWADCQLAFCFQRIIEIQPKTVKLAPIGRNRVLLPAFDDIANGESQ